MTTRNAPTAIAPLVISSDLRRRIESEGAAAYPNECCGILVGRDVKSGSGSPRRVVDRLEPGKNVFAADEQYHRFSIDPLAQLRAERAAEAEGKLVVGYYHSHPDHPARPSEYDREHGWPFYSYVIVSVAKGKPVDMTSWVLNGNTNQFEQQEIVGQ
jgi:proteasome lid subunit RPN8/RPN11